MFHVLEQNILKITKTLHASHKLYIIVGVWGGGGGWVQKGSTKLIVNNVFIGTLNLARRHAFISQNVGYIFNVSILYFFRCHWRKMKNSRPETWPEVPHRPQRILWGMKFALLTRMGMQLSNKGEISHKCNTYNNNIT